MMLKADLVGSEAAIQMYYSHSPLHEPTKISTHMVDAFMFALGQYRQSRNYLNELTISFSFIFSSSAKHRILVPLDI